MSLPVPVMGVIDEVGWLRLAVEASVHAQLVWCTWHASQFCVSVKLRTPLGKPMETFTAIEGMLYTNFKPILANTSFHFFAGAIKSLARQLNNDASTNNDTSPMTELHRTRQACLLLAFLEHLEKNMYNAAEGCAFAMPFHPKVSQLRYYHVGVLLAKSCAKALAYMLFKRMTELGHEVLLRKQ
jgi:hypothetical protein